MATESPFNTILKTLEKPGGGEFGKYYSLPALNDSRIDKLPYSIKILLESVIRNCDEFQIKTKDVQKILIGRAHLPNKLRFCLSQLECCFRILLVFLLLLISPACVML